MIFSEMIELFKLYNIGIHDIYIVCWHLIENTNSKNFPIHFKYDFNFTYSF